LAASAQTLINTGKLDERYWLETAASIVLDKMRDGALLVRGRLRGQTGSEPVQAARHAFSYSSGWVLHY
jgi:hypothetical protein